MSVTVHDLKQKINAETLEEDPELYLKYLKEYRSNTENTDALRYVMNCLSSYGFESPPIMQLSYLVGRLVVPYPDWIGDSPFYGQTTAISEDLGCSILSEMIAAGADIYVENFHEENIQSSLTLTYTLTHRENNEKFKNKVNELFAMSSPPVKGKGKGKGRIPPPPPLSLFAQINDAE
jgi:hypothetical protein